MNLVLKDLQVDLRFTAVRTLTSKPAGIFPLLNSMRTFGLFVPTLPAARHPVSQFPLPRFLRLRFLPGFSLPSRPLSADALLPPVSFNPLNIGVCWGPAHVLTFSGCILFNYRQCWWVPNSYFEPEFHSESFKYSSNSPVAIPHWHVTVS